MHYEAVMESREELGRFLFWCVPEYSRDHSGEWIGMQDSLWDEGREYNFAVEECSSGRFLGSVALNRIDRVNRTACLGWWVCTGMTGHGIATAAARLAVRFAFEDAGLVRLEAIIQATNIPSIRVAEKLGAVREGVLRKRIFIHGASHDAVCYSLIADDFAAV